MSLKVVWGLLIPFIGTSAGAGCVFFMKRNLSTAVQRALTGFAAGVMVAASVWSLIIPAMEQTKAMGICTCGNRVLDRYFIPVTLRYSDTSFAHK